VPTSRANRIDGNKLEHVGSIRTTPPHGERIESTETEMNPHPDRTNLSYCTSSSWKRVSSPPSRGWPRSRPGALRPDLAGAGPPWRAPPRGLRYASGCTPCSLGLSATSQQYFSLRTNQPLATSQQYFSLRTNQHQSSATSQTNRLVVDGVVASLLRARGALPTDENVRKPRHGCWSPANFLGGEGSTRWRWLSAEGRSGERRGDKWTAGCARWAHRTAPDE
jgi:hypothetical protein